MMMIMIAIMIVMIMMKQKQIQIHTWNTQISYHNKGDDHENDEDGGGLVGG